MTTRRYFDQSRRGDSLAVDSNGPEDENVLFTALADGVQATASLNKEQVVNLIALLRGERVEKPPVLWSDE